MSLWQKLSIHSSSTLHLLSSHGRRDPRLEDSCESVFTLHKRELPWYLKRGVSELPWTWGAFCDSLPMERNCSSLKYSSHLLKFKHETNGEDGGRDAGHSTSLPNVPSRLLCLSSKKLFWQLYVRVREVAPYATQKPILPPSSYKALKKIISSHQDQ